MADPTRTPPPRPRQVTMAAILTIVGALILVVSLFDMLDRLRTPDMRESIAETLAEPPLSGLDVGVAQVVDLMRGMVFVSGALAAAGFVLGIFVLQRHRGARLGLSVVTGLLLLTIPVAGILPVLLAVAVTMLWSAPARAWFDGRPATPPSPRPVAPAAPRPPDLPALTGTASPDDQPPPEPRAFASEQQSQADPVPTLRLPAEAPAQPPAQPPTQWAYGGPARTDRRPGAVIWAAILTWVCSAAVAFVLTVFAAVLAFDPDFVMAEFDRAAEGSGVVLSRSQVLATSWAVVALFLLWAFIASVLAVLAFRRSQAGRFGLVASAVATALVSLVSIVSIAPIVTLLAAIATVVLLFTGPANRWFARRDDEPGQWHQPPAYPAGPPSPHPPAPPPAYPPPPKQKIKPW